MPKVFNIFWNSEYLKLEDGAAHLSDILTVCGSVVASEGRGPHMNDSKCDWEAGSVNFELTPWSVKFSSRISISPSIFLHYVK